MQSLGSQGAKLEDERLCEFKVPGVMGLSLLFFTHHDLQCWDFETHVPNNLKPRTKNRFRVKGLTFSNLIPQTISTLSPQCILNALPHTFPTPPNHLTNASHHLINTSQSNPNHLPITSPPPPNTSQSPPQHFPTPHQHFPTSPQHFPTPQQHLPTPPQHPTNTFQHLPTLPNLLAEAWPWLDHAGESVARPAE